MSPFRQPNASVFVPDGLAPDAALARTTHLGIGAHQDDLEFMALHGILACFQHSDRWFSGVTCTDGAGSARTGPYADCTDEDMKRIRRGEQDTAARIGHYGAMIQLDYGSGALKTSPAADVRDDLAEILDTARPEVVYTHNLADRHDTHIGVTIAVVDAIRGMPADRRPRQVLGCEVWRDLDWMMDDDKAVLDVSAHENLAASLNGVFDSQIAGGKRYDLAVMGRRRANATFLESHATDALQQAWLAMDLTPLAHDESLDIPAFVGGFVERFADDVRARVGRRLGLAP